MPLQPLIMDLLGGYGSGSDEDSGDDRSAPPPQAKLSAPKPPSFASALPPPSSAPRSSAPAGPSASAPHRSGPPAGARLPADDDESDLGGSSTSSVFSRLPQPQGPVKRIVSFEVIWLIYA